jgi:hypothetical protein
LNLKENEEAHRSEHSIEVQLPFLQFVSPNNDIKILPIIISNDLSYDIIAKQVVKTIWESKKKVVLIASSDFTHYGINYGYFPFRNDVKGNMYELDKKAIRFIEKLDAYRFLDYINESGATICGNRPIATLIEICKLLGAKKANLLKYYTSGDVINDYSSAVGYASIVIEK